MKRNNELCNIRYTVKSIDGNQCNYERCIGFCNNMCHRGFVTENLLKRHECIRKKCIFLDIMEDHPFWIARAEKKRESEQNKKHRIVENAIVEETKKYLSSPAKPIFCKHLYDSDYLLVLIKCTHSLGLSQILKFDLKVNVHIKIVNSRKEQNIEYTYMSLLDEKTQEKIKKMAK